MVEPARSEPAHAVQDVPGLDELADAVLTLRTLDEARRFLRDLCTLGELEALAHRWQIARLVASGRSYLEIAETVHTSAAEVVTLAELGFARCTLEAAVPADARQTTLADLEGLRVATAYPTSTRSCLDRLGITVSLVTISGSVEAAPRLGLADAIVDLVSTGSTASANGLRRIGSLLESQAILLRSPRSDGDKDELVERL